MVEPEHTLRNAALDLPDLVISVPSVWDLLREVRRRVDEHLKGVDAELREVTVMAASELVENAVKYGRSVPSCAEASLRLQVGEGRVDVRVSSGIRSFDAAKETLDRVATIRRAPDKMALYLQRMKALLDHPVAVGGSTQLGLFRVSGEGEFELSCELKDDVLNITASRELS